MTKENHNKGPDLDQLLDARVFIAAAETEDELGCVLRLHLLVERLLNSYIDAKLNGPMTEFVPKPQTFAGKLSVSVLLGFPIALAAVVKQINRMRNQLAHEASASLTDHDMKELSRRVENLAVIEPGFASLKRRYVELPVKRPGEKIGFGTDSRRIDFLIAACAFLTVAVKVVLIESRHLLTSHTDK